MITPVACAVLAAFELDAVLIAQTLVSRPLVAGAALGALTGKAQTGMLFGVAFELLSLYDLPVGGHLAWSASVATGTATVLASRGCRFPSASSAASPPVFCILASRRSSACAVRRPVTRSPLHAEAGGGRSVGRWDPRSPFTRS